MITVRLFDVFLIVLKYTDRAPVQYDRRDDKYHYRYSDCTYASRRHPEFRAMSTVSQQSKDVEERHAVSSNGDDVGEDEESDKLPVRSPTLSQHPRKDRDGRA